MAKKKDKVVEIGVVKPREVLKFPEGDRRNEMTAEEIAAFAAEEEAQIERDLRVVAAAQKAKEARKDLYEGGVEVEEDDDEEEFELDLKNGVAKQIVGEGVVVLNGQNVSDLVDTIKPYQDTYGDIIKTSLIQFAVGVLRSDLTKALDQLESLRWDHELRLPSSVGEGIYAEHDKVWNMKRELSSFSHRSVIKEEDIPEWARPQVERYIRGAMNQLLSLVNKEEL